MQITAKLVQVLPLQKGAGKNGEWRKQDVIVETDGQYPKKVCISIWGDKINESQLVAGKILKLDFDVESREFNGKWYTDCKAWKVEIAGESSATNTDMGSMPAPDFGSSNTPTATDDLPF